MADPAPHSGLIERYRDAYEAANGYRPKGVRYAGRGWFHVPLSTTKVRARELEEMTDVLERRAQIRAGG